MGILTKLFFSASIIFAGSSVNAGEFPKGSRWLEHLNGDLLPFWTVEAALGNPLGAFPTYRCDNATLFDPKRPCAELVRRPVNDRIMFALSRQIYGYGVAFHVTGDATYLDLMKAGINFIRQNAIDRANGGMAIIQNGSTGTWGPPPPDRNPQQLGYGLLGLAFYYYLTRDEEVLKDIVSVKKYIFEKYSDSTGLLQWQPQLQGPRRLNKRLVAQLDQMNTYLSLLAPIVPAPDQVEWKSNLVQISQVLIDQFFSPTDKLFFLTANQPSEKTLASAGTDFGHTAKALWMIRRAGLVTGNARLVSFAEENADELLKRAYLEDCGCWAGGYSRGDVLDKNKSWWVYNELDQLAGTLALSNPKYAKNLPKTYDYWFSRFVDKTYGEVWNVVDGNTHVPVRGLPKQWEWKNAYHTFEHALVGYIVAQEMHREPLILYYAFSGNALPNDVQPYYFAGRIKGSQTIKENPRWQVQKITFENVR